MKKINSDSYRPFVMSALIILLSVSVAKGSGLHDINKEKHENQPGTEAAFQKQIYEKVDVMPVYPGGDTALVGFLGRNIRYPEAAKKNVIQGLVMVRFCVTDLGTVENIQVVKGVEKSLDDESVRVVKMLKGWTPGKLKGENVNVWYTVPITYKLH